MDLMLTIFFVSALIVALGAVEKSMQKMLLTDPLVSMIAGIALGPELLNILHFDNPDNFTILKIAAEFTMAMALMATALRIPRYFYTSNFVTQTVTVIGGMVLMWLASTGIFYLLLGSFAESLLLGAIVTPTDPVIASTIVTGEKAKKYLPASIRNTLSFEAGVNDGLAYPIVLLTVFFVSTGDFSLQGWLTQTLLYEVVLCGILAYGIGYLAGVAMINAHKRKMMDTRSILSFSLALAFLLLSGLNMLNMNGIIGVFIGGIAYSNNISKNDEIQEQKVQETMERLFTLPVFFIFGLMLPWQEWVSLGWTALGIVLLILFFRRIPAFLALKPVLPRFKAKLYDVLVLGWYGPIGVAALYYAILVRGKTSLDEAWIIPSLIIFASTVVHGLTSLPVEKWYHNKSG